MPDLTVTVTPAQATRLGNAFAFLNATPQDPDGSPATPAQVEAWMKQELKAHVMSYELRTRRAQAEADALAAVEGEGWGA